MLSWRLDHNGAPVEILYRIRRDCPGSLLDPVDNTDEQHEYRFWTEQAWYVYAPKGGNVGLIEEGVNQLAINPAVGFVPPQGPPVPRESLLKTLPGMGNWYPPGCRISMPR